MEHKEVCKTVKLEIKRLKINEMVKYVFVVNDISSYLDNQKARLKDNFSKQLTATFCHEVMTPLNCIINISEFLRTSCNKVFKLT